jgi:ribonucleotide reductase alpha subunit
VQSADAPFNFPVVQPVTVRKRDGRTTQPFDVGKIESAVRKAWVEAEGSVDEEALHCVATFVSATLHSDVTDVEQIQDVVEVALMRANQFKVAKAYIIYRQKRTEARAVRQQPDASAVSDYIHASKYARYVPEMQRREVYEETVAREEGMHLRRFAHIPELLPLITRAHDLVREKKVLPSMRSMQFGGTAIEANHNRIYNCSATLIDRPRAFAEAMFLLLSGCGVGYSVQIEHVEKLPALVDVDEKKVVHHVIDDTIEGWANALDALINSYIGGYYVEFAFNKIRGAGAPLKTSGGRAPGHQKLKLALERVRKVLHSAQGRQLRPIECHRILCHAADAVLSGGIRRSAMICLFSIEDSELMHIKADRDWYDKEPWLANANNSVVLKRDEVKEKHFKRIFGMTKNFGEPGVLFVSDYNHVTNPCVPPGTRILTREGYVAIETCVNRPTVVWNGLEWRTVTPHVTGHDQPIVRVHLSDGTSLDCTDYHEWCVAAGKWSRDHTEERVRAIDLEEGDTLMRYDMPLVENGVDMPYAYSHGFWCADGTVEDAGRKTAMCYGIKRGLIARMEHGGAVERISDDTERGRSRVVFTSNMPDKFVVPHNTSIQSRLDWVAGLLDGDGSVVKNPKSVGLQLSSVNVPFLREVRLLLTTLGVQAKIAEMHEGGMRLLPDGRGGKAEYLTQPSFRLLINATDTHRLVRAGLRTSRLDLSAAETLPQRDARRFVTVTAVERLAPAPVVYCFTEESNHTGTFEGIVTGQCAEIGLDPLLVHEDGTTSTGWAMCNLCEINAAKLTSFEDFSEAAWAATLIGTMQATYTDMPYLGKVTEAIVRRDALLGIGMTGMQDAPHIACHPDYQRVVAGKVVDWNREYAALLGINQAARTTCVKPSGTTSLELGNVGSGIHPHHARRYIRRVTADELEVVFQAFKTANPHMCVKKPDGKWVIEFPVEAPEGAVLKEDLTAEQFMEMVRSTQQNWVVPGATRPSHAPGLSHNVSNTITVRSTEWAEVADYLWKHRDNFTGVSLLSDTGDMVYAFAPFEAVKTEAQERRWNELIVGYTPIDYLSVFEAEDGTNLTGEAACANGACEWRP